MGHLNADFCSNDRVQASSIRDESHSTQQGQLSSAFEGSSGSLAGILAGNSCDRGKVEAQDFVSMSFRK